MSLSQRLLLGDLPSSGIEPSFVHTSSPDPLSGTPFAPRPQPTTSPSVVGAKLVSFSKDGSRRSSAVRGGVPPAPSTSTIRSSKSHHFPDSQHEMIQFDDGVSDFDVDLFTRSQKVNHLKGSGLGEEGEGRSRQLWRSGMGMGIWSEKSENHQEVHSSLSLSFLDEAMVLPSEEEENHSSQSGETTKKIGNTQRRNHDLGDGDSGSGSVPAADSTALLEESLLRLEEAPTMLFQDPQKTRQRMPSAITEHRQEGSADLDAMFGKMINDDWVLGLDCTERQFKEDRIHDSMRPRKGETPEIDLDFPTTEDLQRHASTLQVSLMRAQSKLSSLRENRSKLERSIEEYQEKAHSLSSRLEKERELREFQQVIVNARLRTNRTPRVSSKEDQFAVRQALENLRLQMLEGVRAERKQLVAKTAGLREELEDLEGRYREKCIAEKQRILQQREEIQGLNSEISAMHGLLEQREKRIQQIREELDSSRKTASSTSSSEGEAERLTIVRLREQVEKAAETSEYLSQLKKLNQRLQNQIASLRMECEKRTSIANDLSFRLKDSESAQSQKLRQLALALENSREETRRLREQMDHSQEAIQTPIRESARLRKKNQELRGAIRQLETEMARMHQVQSDRLRNLEEEKELHVRNIIKRVTGERQSLIRERNSATAAHQSLQVSSRRTVDSLKARIAKEEARRTEIEKRISEQNREYSSIEESLQEHQRRCVVLNDDLRHEQLQTKGLRAELSRLQSDFEKLKRERDEERTKCAGDQKKMTLYVMKVRSRKKRHEYELRQLQEKVSRLTRMAGEKDHQISALSNQVRILRID